MIMSGDWFNPGEKQHLGSGVLQRACPYIHWDSVFKEPRIRNVTRVSRCLFACLG